MSLKVRESSPISLSEFTRARASRLPSAIRPAVSERLRSGAVMLRSVTEDYAQVGMFGVSYQTFMAAVLSTNQIASSFVPLLAVLRARRRAAELRRDLVHSTRQ